MERLEKVALGSWTEGLGWGGGRPLQGGVTLPREGRLGESHVHTWADRSRTRI